jgi:transposase
MTSLSEIAEVVIGVDTHVCTHSAAAVDARTGGVLGEVTVEATAGGYQVLVDFADRYSGLRAWAIEGTGGHGAGLARLLARRYELVLELDRPERARRRNGAKSDPLDAIRAAREALSRAKLGTPRSTGQRQALSVLLAARRSAVQAGGDAQRQLFSLVIAAPEELRERFRGDKLPAMIRRAARLRISPRWDAETATTATVLRDLAQRALALGAEAARHEKDILAHVRSWRPDLLTQLGVGPIVAATVLCAWSHPGRIRSEAAFAMLAGAAPIPANSGQTTTRYRLNRYGDRQLNRALHTAVLARLRYDPATQAYAKRRTTEGKTPREIKRCLKRYLARDLYRLLENPSQPT